MFKKLIKFLKMKYEQFIIREVDRLAIGDLWKDYGTEIELESKIAMLEIEIESKDIRIEELEEEKRILDENAYYWSKRYHVLKGSCTEEEFDEYYKRG